MTLNWRYIGVDLAWKYLRDAEDAVDSNRHDGLVEFRVRSMSIDIKEQRCDETDHSKEQRGSIRPGAGENNTKLADSDAEWSFHAHGTSLGGGHQRGNCGLLSP